MLIAVTRPVSPSLAKCELTHLGREPIDVVRAAEQHAAYEDLLRALGATIVRAPAAPDFPDAVFVEDAAIVFDEVAVITRPGAASRQGETATVTPVLARYRRLRFIEPPGTLDGGDTLLLGRTLFVGRSGRTNDDGIEQLKRLLSPLDYRVVPVEFYGCLHLKSAVTAVADDVLLMNPDWISSHAFPRCEMLHVDPDEPYGANALRVAGTVIYPSQHPRTHDLLVRRGLRVVTTDTSELAKAEGAATCCSLIFEHGLQEPSGNKHDA